MKTVLMSKFVSHVIPHVMLGGWRAGPVGPCPAQQTASANPATKVGVGDILPEMEAATALADKGLSFRCAPFLCTTTMCIYSKTVIGRSCIRTKARSYLYA